MLTILVISVILLVVSVIAMLANIYAGLKKDVDPESFFAKHLLLVAVAFVSGIAVLGSGITLVVRAFQH